MGYNTMADKTGLSPFV